MVRRTLFSLSGFFKYSNRTFIDGCVGSFRFHLTNSVYLLFKAENVLEMEVDTHFVYDIVCSADFVLMKRCENLTA